MPEVGKKILVLGGSGFIGRHIINHALKLGMLATSIGFASRREELILNENFEHYTVFKNKPQFLREKIRNTQFDYVVNASGYIDHRSYFNGGRQAIFSHFETLLDLAEIIDRTALKSFINIGSSDEYGNATAPQTENLREAPISPYSLAKVCATHFMQTLHRTEGFPATTVRLFITYGPGQKRDRFLPTVISGCLSESTFSVSEGNQLRDFCYIDDVIRAIFLALTNPKSHGEVINIGSGVPVKIRDVVKTVHKIIGTGRPEFGKIAYRGGENMALYANIEKANAILGWKPLVSLEVGLKKTIETYRN